MAKKRRKPEGDGPKKRKSPNLPDSFEMPDRRTLEGLMRQLVGGIAGTPESTTPLGRAQDIMYQAFEEDDALRRTQLAKKALEISPDCADAYTLLAEQAGSRKEALELLEKAVAAGERALGPKAFREGAGDFWGVLETRPYMRARLELSLALWTSGRRDEAIVHLQEMLRLNPNDNQGARYTLAGYLLDMDRDADLERLLDQYPDDGMATWAYTRVLLSFRKHGDTSETRQLLKEARKINKHVPAFLVGDKLFPREQPPYYGYGDENEAIIYVAGSLTGWKSTPGAVAWVRAVVKPTRKQKPAPSPLPGEGPQPLSKERLRRLPQEEDVWQCDFRPLATWVSSDGEKRHPWTILIASRSDNLILAHELLEETPTADQLWDKLAQAMRKPAAGEKHRPSEVQFRPGEVWSQLLPHLGDIDVACVPVETLDIVDDVLQGLEEYLHQEEPPALLDVPGVTPERVGGFYAAAAFFYKEAPWRKVGYEQAIRVECERFQGGPWYAVIMGQSGMTYGLTLYEDLEQLRRMFTEDHSDEVNARETVATTVIFSEKDEMHPSDLEAGERFGWQVARTDAYPMIFHKERGLSSRPPLAWELELFEACLRVLPGFLSRHSQGDTDREEVSAPAAGGELPLTLSWVPDASD